LTSNGLHDFIFEKIDLLVTTAVRTSNSACHYAVFFGSSADFRPRLNRSGLQSRVGQTRVRNFRVLLSSFVVLPCFQPCNEDMTTVLHPETCYTARSVSETIK
jgi:hypothetical protein